MPFIPFVAANEDGHQIQVKMSQVPGFGSKAVTEWAYVNVEIGSDVIRDGLSCFVGVIHAGRLHSYIVVGGRKPDAVSALKWFKVVLSNLKTVFAAAYTGLKYLKYAEHYLGALSYQFNNRLNLRALVGGLLQDAAIA